MSRAVQRRHLRDEPVEIPVLDDVASVTSVTLRAHRLLDPAADLLGVVVAVEDAAALLVDDHALRVHHVVVLEDVLAGDEVLLLDLLLRALDLAREDRRPPSAGRPGS